MTHSLDDGVAALAAAPCDRPLDGLEAEIGRKIAERRREARTVQALAPVRLATAALALALGITAGGAAATATLHGPPAVSPFAPAAQLAPSTLLEGVG